MIPSEAGLRCFRHWHRSTISEQQLRADLNYPRAPASQPRIGLRLIWRLGDQALGGRSSGRAVRAESRTHEEVREREVWMVEDVEEFSPQLQAHVFRNAGVLRGREIQIKETRPVD